MLLVSLLLETLFLRLQGLLRRLLKVMNLLLVWMGQAFRTHRTNYHIITMTWTNDHLITTSRADGGRRGKKKKENKERNSLARGSQ